MIKWFKKLNIWIKNVAPWLVLWKILLPIIRQIFIKINFTMSTYYLYLISFIIAGLLVTPSVFSVSAYYKQDAKFKEVFRAIANIYLHLAAIRSDSSYCSFLYKQLALAKYVEIKDYQFVRQLLNEIIPLIKEIEKDKIKTEDRTRMNEIFSYLDKNKYNIEIEQINDLLK